MVMAETMIIGQTTIKIVIKMELEIITIHQIPAILKNKIFTKKTLVYSQNHINFIDENNFENLGARGYMDYYNLNLKQNDDLNNIEVSVQNRE